LIRYIVFTGDTGTAAFEVNLSANELPSAPRFDPVESLAQAPAVTDTWHWPWLKGWDDLAKRNRILHPKKKKETSLRRKLMYGLFGAGAVYMGAKYLDEE
jgi:hypothetical protein